MCRQRRNCAYQCTVLVICTLFRLGHYASTVCELMMMHEENTNHHYCCFLFGDTHVRAQNGQAVHNSCLRYMPFGMLSGSAASVAFGLAVVTRIFLIIFFSFASFCLLASNNKGALWPSVSILSSHHCRHVQPTCMMAPWQSARRRGFAPDPSTGRSRG